jgi:hypothetical protein
MDSSALEDPTSARLWVQSQVFEAVASGATLTGTLDDLTRQFGVTPGDLLDGLDELVRAGWVALDIDPESRFSIRLQHEPHALNNPVSAAG